MIVGTDRGFSFRLSDCRLWVNPADRLDPDDATAIKAHRNGIVALLVGDADRQAATLREQLDRLKRESQRRADEVEFLQTKLLKAQIEAADLRHQAGGWMGAGNALTAGWPIPIAAAAMS